MINFLSVHDKRQFQRFNVSQFASLSGYVERHGSLKKLITFGEGGAGFYGDYDDVLQPIKRVNCIFRMAGQSEVISVLGYIIYCRSIKLGAEEVTFYGVEFIESERKKVAPLMHEIQANVQTGVVQPC